MGAIDAEATGARVDKPFDKVLVGGTLWRHCHHDAGIAPAGIVAEKPCLIIGDLHQSCVENCRFGPSRGQSGQPVKRCADGGERLAQMGFRASER